METKKTRRYKGAHIALDFDKTLFHHESSWGISKIGEPIDEMVERVKHWVNLGHRITIFTARMCPVGPRGEDRSDQPEEQKRQIQDALESIGLPRFDVTCMKLSSFTHFIDDKGYHVKRNTGELWADKYLGLDNV